MSGAGVELEPVTVERVCVGRCPRCRAGVSTGYGAARDAGWQLQCGCGAWAVLEPVQGTVSARACGAHCEDAVTTGCRCECGGTRHGVTWRVGTAPAREVLAPREVVAPLELLAPADEIAPVRYELHPLQGIRWPAAVRVDDGARAGQIAMFAVEDAGELQDWFG